MSGYPAFNDREFDLLKKITENTAALAGVGAALNLSYVAATPAHWAGSPPTTIGEAINRLAAANHGA